MIGTIETELHKNGYFTMLQSVSRSSDILSLVKNWNVDGMILVFPTSAQNLEKLMDAANCPIATFDSNYSHPNLINVISDDEKGRQNLYNIGTGNGYYITDGYAVKINWTKESRSSETKYTYLDGTEIDVNDGNTFIQIQPKGQDLSIKGNEVSSDVE
jgi:hypothetical protein